MVFMKISLNLVWTVCFRIITTYNILNVFYNYGYDFISHLLPWLSIFHFSIQHSNASQKNEGEEEKE